MVSKTAEYKVGADDVEVAIKAIKDFVQGIKDNEPQTKYAAHQLSDKVSFFHTMQFPDHEAEMAHKGAPYTLNFVDTLYPRCEVEPIFKETPTPKPPASATLIAST